MDVMRPTYLDFLAALSATGRATRPAVEIEAQLSLCRRCGRWQVTGCTLLNAREFAALLADAGARCPADSGG